MSWVPQENEEYEVVLSYGLNEDGDMDVHSATGFCPIPFCMCHSDDELIGETNELYEDGLLTLREFNLTVQGRTV